MSIHIAVTTGETVTPAQLIGEGEGERADKFIQAELGAAELEARALAQRALPKQEGGTWREA